MKHKSKKIYFIGIEGAGTSALAKMYRKLGCEVTGSDNGDHFYAEVLRAQKIRVFNNFAAENIPKDTDLVVYSTAFFKDDNPEIKEARRRKIKMISYPEALGDLFNDRTGIAVCGTHGKTTTSAMLAEVLRFSGLDPAAIVGSMVSGWQGGMLFGKGDLFVAEADEYQDKLRFYNPWSIILTSADWDHPDFFPSKESYLEVFKRFVARVPKSGHLIVWGDSINTLEASKSCNGKIVKYGFGADNDYRIEGYVAVPFEDGRLAQSFSVFIGEELLGEFELRLSGKHNALNACSVIAMCHKLGVSIEKIRDALKEFKGTSRRFELVGKYEGALLIDDYAHHPDEIRATLKGARERFPNKNIWAVFQPHTFSRTKELLHEFSQSFDDADKVIVLDIYASARESEGVVKSQDLVDLVNKYTNGKSDYIATIKEVVEHLSTRIGENDVVILIGAGNVWEIGKKLLKK